MGYTIKGNLRANLHIDLYETLDNVQVRVYRVMSALKGAQDLKNQLYKLTAEMIEQKSENLLGTGFTDADGNYTIDICDAYKEGEIEIDLVVSDINSITREKQNPVQFTARRLNPIWRKVNQNKEFSWNYSFSFQFWDQIRRSFDIWTIVGNIKSAVDKQTPVAGAIVSAIDVDWIKDDFLGRAVSNRNGKFRIDYKSIDFKQTYLSPLISIETPISSFPGPGVYFKITSSDGILLYEEHRSVGKTQERRNIPRFFNIDLYI
ncbi:hypothetical protein [Zobellia uliginosa]|uniref:hypothetical protein n=1 Tax=Zobellia uliginosa TaxID=143224 RepID=UPI001C067063|nr:hypothetical protein [Zobellia uliginosa]MBU2946749.1 hypothetical protein [Zobellia uliginosa]